MTFEEFYENLNEFYEILNEFIIMLKMPGLEKDE